MTATVDFMLASPTADHKGDRSILKYSTQPSMDVTHYSQLRDDEETYAERSDLPPAGLKAFKEIFTPAHANMQSRSPPQSLWVQNAWGILKHAKTTQDDLPLVEKRGYDWMRARETYEGYAKQAGALAWLMDAAISFAPLSYSHRFLQDAAAASTLSFNLAYHDEEIALDEKWHLREIRTTDGRWERTTGEAKLWVEDQEVQGGEVEAGRSGMRCVATMTQSCVLKAKPQVSPSKL
jgi:acyl-CoA thioesterase